MTVLLFLDTCILAYSNGANDNFKSVASLFGSQTTSYRVAVGWATVTTFLGWPVPRDSDHGRRQLDTVPTEHLSDTTLPGISERRNYLGSDALVLQKRSLVVFLY